MKEGKQGGNHCLAWNESEQRRWVPISSHILVCTVWADPLTCAQGEIKDNLERTSSVAIHFLFSWDSVSHQHGNCQVGKAKYQPAPGIQVSPVSLSQHWNCKCMPSYSTWFFTWLLGTRFRFLFSKGKHFTHGVSSFFHIYPKSLQLKIAH